MIDEHEGVEGFATDAWIVWGAIALVVIASFALGWFVGVLTV